MANTARQQCIPVVASAPECRQWGGWWSVYNVPHMRYYRGSRTMYLYAQNQSKPSTAKKSADSIGACCQYTFKVGRQITVGLLMLSSISETE